MAQQRYESEDQRVLDILAYLKAGMSREEIAGKYGHKDKQAIDQYMRRHQYKWGEFEGTYLKSPNHPEYSETDRHIIPAKVQRILTEFRSVTADPRELARRLGLKDPREMGKYMSENGFVWSSDKHNYVRGIHTEQEGQAHPSSPTQNMSVARALRAGPSVDAEPPSDWVIFLPLLQHLYENQERLLGLLEQAPLTTLTIPRYALSGGYLSKTVHMHVGLEELVRDFSQEKNIPQREVVEVALVQFFYRYGYEKRIEMLV